METLPPGTRLGPYEVRDVLGRGGMGVVYRGRDSRLDREVAIKLLSAEVSGLGERRLRFEREARAVARLNHPNILTLHDIGEHGGSLYLVTELLAGETLRQRLGRGPVPWASAVRWTNQVAEGLAAAHERGIVHRDLKPENVWITPEERVKVLDFGIAKMSPERAGAAATTLTEAGLAPTEAGTLLGTTAYMSPEQARGEPVDARSDLFALGIILYEAIAGERPFRGSSTIDVLAAILHLEPPALRPPSDGPAGLSRIVGRCLEKEPQRRFAGARDLAFALQALLDRPAAESSAATATSGAVATTTRAPETSPRIAVLPFADLSPERDQEVLCQGLAEELGGALAKLPGLRVVARSSALRFQSQDEDPRAIGRRLQVDKLIEGSVRRSGSRLRIGVELVNVEDGYQLWSERYDREAADLFAVQDDIAARVIEALTQRLVTSPPPSQRYQRNLEAHHLYLKGRYFWNKRHEGGLLAALRAFEEAIDQDPLHAPAYAGIADTYALLGSWFDVLPGAEAMPRAKAAARRALEIDDTLAAAYASLGWVALHHDWDWPASEAHFRRSIELDPQRATTRHWYSFFLSAMGRREEALAEARAAWECDPLALIINAQLAQPLYYARRFEETIAEAERLVRMEPAFPISHQWLGMGLAAVGRYDEAIRELQLLAEAFPKAARPMALIANLQARAGEREAALRAREELRQAAASGQSRAMHVAFVDIGLGATDEAFAWLEQAYEEHSDQLAYLAVEPFFDPLRGDPRFARLLERLRLAPAVE